MTATAHHEAAHYLAFLVAGREPVSASVVPGEGIQGTVLFKNSDVYSWDDAVSLCFCCMAGAAAGLKFEGKDPSDFLMYGMDHYWLASALDMFNRTDQEQIIAEAKAKTERFLDRNWHKIARLARALHKHKHLTRREIEGYLNP